MFPCRRLHAERVGREAHGDHRRRRARAALAVELRDPSGAVVETEDISINDTYRMLAIGREAMRKSDPDFEFDDAEPWEAPPPRYL
jgi:hypothetical protein